MAKGPNNSYEEARKQRLEENKRRFEELGVKKIASSLNDDFKKKKRENQVKPNQTPVNPDLVRRSSRPRNQVTYYKPSKKCKSYIQGSDALMRAESFQSGLSSRNPSFVKLMTFSQVDGQFSLCLPFKVCNHLPEDAKVRIVVLEDEEGSLYETHYYGSKYLRLQVGWKAFSTDHKLAVGDALVIELIEPTRFKVHIFRVSEDVGEVKVGEPKKARESETVKTVGAEQITKPTERRNP